MACIGVRALDAHARPGTAPPVLARHVMAWQGSAGHRAAWSTKESGGRHTPGFESSASARGGARQVGTGRVGARLRGAAFGAAGQDREQLEDGWNTSAFESLTSTQGGEGRLAAIQVRGLGAHARHRCARRCGAWQCKARRGASRRCSSRLRKAWDTTERAAYPKVRVLGAHAGHCWSRHRSAVHGKASQGQARHGFHIGREAHSGVRVAGARARLGIASAVLGPAALGWARHGSPSPGKAWRSTK